MGLNRAIVMGRLTRDPELRHTQSGVAVASFTLAVDRDFAPKDGERETDFVDIVAWRHTAEFVSKYFSKGKMAVVDGRIQVRGYEDKDGNKRKAFEIVADSVYFGESKKDSDRPPHPADQSGYQQSNQHSYSSQPSSDFEELDIDDGELPF